MIRNIFQYLVELCVLLFPKDDVPLYLDGTFNNFNLTGHLAWNAAAGRWLADVVTMAKDPLVSLPTFF